MDWLGVVAGVLTAFGGGRNLWVMRRTGDLQRKRGLAVLWVAILVVGLSLAIANL